MRILSIHDLGETGKNACYGELIKHRPENKIVSHAYDLAENDPALILFDSMASGPYDLIVGTGFGGVLALLLGRATGVRTVLINPMHPIQRYLPTEHPGYKYGVHGSLGLADIAGFEVYDQLYLASRSWRTHAVWKTFDSRIRPRQPGERQLVSGT